MDLFLKFQNIENKIYNNLFDTLKNQFKEFIMKKV